MMMTMILPIETRHEVTIFADDETYSNSSLIYAYIILRISGLLKYNSRLLHTVRHFFVRLTKFKRLQYLIIFADEEARNNDNSFVYICLRVPYMLICLYKY